MNDQEKLVYLFEQLPAKGRALLLRLAWQLGPQREEDRPNRGGAGDGGRARCSGEYGAMTS